MLTRRVIVLHMISQWTGSESSSPQAHDTW